MCRVHNTGRARELEQRVTVQGMRYNLVLKVTAATTTTTTTIITARPLPPSALRATAIALGLRAPATWGASHTRRVTLGSAESSMARAQWRMGIWTSGQKVKRVCVRSRGGPAMDWPRPRLESSYLWDRVPQPLRCYLYDLYLLSISLSLALLPTVLLSRFLSISFLVFLSFSYSSSLLSFSFCLSLCYSPALFPRSYSLPALCFPSSFHFLLRALYPPGLLLSVATRRSSRFALIWKLPARRCFLERQIAIRLYPRICHCISLPRYALFDCTSDTAATMREYCEHLLLSRSAMFAISNRR